MSAPRRRMRQPTEAELEYFARVAENKARMSREVRLARELAHRSLIRARNRPILEHNETIEAVEEARRIAERLIERRRVEAIAFKKSQTRRRLTHTRHALKRLKQLRLATPKWANKEEMKAIYREAQRIQAATKVAQAVDHIVPLQSNKVCGLHCQQNLRIVSRDENHAKKNRWWPDMP